MQDNYDTPWKMAVSDYFREFMAFYFPAAYSEIDWQHPVAFLDQELSQLAPDAVIGPRRVNSGRSPPPSCFAYEVLGCELQFDFPSVALRDYADDLEALLKDENPFALMTAAHILTQRTRHQHSERHAAKRHLFTLLYEHGWTQGRIIVFMRTIAWMMRLPAAMETALWQELQHLEKEYAMEYMLPFEREAAARGKLEGLEQGLERGLEQGRQQGQAALVERQLRLRFGLLPNTVQQRLVNANSNELTAWADALLSASSLDDIFGPQHAA